MKILAFDVCDYEKMAFAKYEKELGLDITYTPKKLNSETKEMIRGYAGVTFLGHSPITRDVLETMKKYNVKYAAGRTIGFDNIDIESAKEFGIRVSNARYDPYNVADFTVMLMLMLMRRAKVSICGALVNDFSLDSLKGREMRNMTVGVVGTGRIGSLLIKNLSGFGCRILANDRYENEEIKDLVEYVDLDKIYEESDIITLHVPLTRENYHMINKDTISKMKDGVILINTARGALINCQDLINALENEKVGGAGIDTIEGEEGIVHVRIGTEIIDKRDLLYLKQFPNVIFTQHYAFFTEEAISDMVKSALYSLNYFNKGEKNPFEVCIK